MVASPGTKSMRRSPAWGRRLSAVLAMSLLTFGTVVSVAVPVSAGSKTGTVDFATEDSVARAANGDTVEISGDGTFSLQPKSVSGEGGTFTHRDPAGNIRAVGTW